MSSHKSSKSTPVFTMKDLRVMYQDRLKHLGASKILIDSVNITRLKDELLRQIPGLCEEKSGKYVMLTLDGDVGRAHIESSLNSSKEEGIILAIAAKIVRKKMFLKQEVFDGDFSKHRQRSSVNYHLLHLLLNGKLLVMTQ